MSKYSQPKTKPVGTIYVPKDFCPEDHPGPIADHPEAALWFLNCVYFYTKVRNYKDDKLINLNAKLLGMVMGDINYVKPIRDQLEGLGLIRCDHHCIKNFKSFSFRLGPDLDRPGSWKRFSFNNKRFNKRVVAFKEYVRTPTGFEVPVHGHLQRWAYKIEVSPSLVCDHLDCDDDKKDLAATQVQLIREEYIRTSVCPYGRFHSNFSGLCREIRPYLSYQGSPLAEIDIVNSQPYFLALLLINEFVSPSSSSASNVRFQLPSSIDSSLFTSSSHSSSLLSSSSPERGSGRGTPPYDSGLCPIRESGETQEVIPRDLMDFLKATIEGTFYETLSGDHGLSRDQLKKKVFQIIYGKPFIMERSSLSRTFKGIFPTVFAMLLEMKKSKGFEWLGRELQRRESRSMINGVCERLREDNPDIPVVTIHDSIMTTQEHIGTILEYLNDEFGRYAYRPKFKIKPAIALEPRVVAQELVVEPSSTVTDSS